MDRHTLSAVQRLDMVETGRRRRWSEDEKLRIVLESLSGPRQVSATARRHGISRSLLLIWRRTFRASTVQAASASGFVSAVVLPEQQSAPLLTAPEPRPLGSRDERIEIVLRGGRRVFVSADVNLDSLTRILDAVERR